MRILIFLLVLFSPIANVFAADACVPVRKVAFDRFFADTLKVSVPLEVLVPEGYEHVELREGATYHRWMRPEAAAGVLATGDLPVTSGYLYGKVSMNVGYDRATNTFLGMDGPEVFAQIGFTEVHIEPRTERNGHALVFLDMTKDDKRIYGMFVGLNIDTNVAYLSYTPPGNNRELGDCFWKEFKRVMLDSPAVASSPSSPMADAAFYAEVRRSEGAHEALMTAFMAAARAGDVDSLLAMLSPASLEDSGDAQVRAFLRDEIVPFFADVAQLDTYTHTNGASFEDGTTGILHYGYVVTKDGRHKPWHIALREEGGQPRVVNVFVGECVAQRHPVGEGRCER